MAASSAEVISRRAGYRPRASADAVKAWKTGQPSIVTPDLFRGPPIDKGYQMRDREPCVYILASGPNGTPYVGVTSNLVTRLVQHRDGRFGGFTKRYGITRLVHFESAETMEAAIRREKTLKRWRRDWKRNLIERDNPTRDDLATLFGLESSTISPAIMVDPGTSPG
jgi:putative endonuclease